MDTGGNDELCRFIVNYIRNSAFLFEKGVKPLDKPTEIGYTINSELK